MDLNTPGRLPSQELQDAAGHAQSCLSVAWARQHRLGWLTGENITGIWDVQYVTQQGSCKQRMKSN